MAMQWRLQRGLYHTSITSSSGRQPLHVVSAAKRQSKKKRESSGSGGFGSVPLDPRSLYDVELEEEQDGSVVLPEAPATRDRRNPRQAADGGAGDFYPVWKPEPGSIKQVRGGPWGWDDEEAEDAEKRRAAAAAAAPTWSPRSGFVQPPQLDAVTGAGGDKDAAPSPAEEEPYEPRVDLTLPATWADEEEGGVLPYVSRGQILSACAWSSISMAGVALFLRGYAQGQATLVLGTDPAVLSHYLAVPPGLTSVTDVAVMVGAAAVVTAARWQLRGVWTELREATDRANMQVLTPLKWPDIALVAALSGASEELLFRGAIIPASFLDWRGVLLAGTIFGGLHASGGRNLAFATWAAGVGCLYGSAFLYTGNIWVAAGAHTLANFVSAVTWQRPAVVEATVEGAAAAADGQKRLGFGTSARGGKGTRT